MESLFETLHLDPRVFLINVVGFAILVILLKRFLWGPLMGLVELRREEISQTYAQADAARAEMERLRADYEQRLSTVEAEARARIQAAIKEAQGAREEILSEAREHARQVIERGQKEIEHERAKAMAALRAEVASLAIGAAARILEEHLDEARHRKLVDEFINQIGRA